MARLLVPSEVLDRVRREMERSVLRVRNGIGYVARTGPVEAGLSPKDTVWSKDKVSLWRYRSDAVSHHPPVVVIHSLISHSYILDMAPKDSFVGGLRDAGFDVFLIDWGVPDEVEAANTLETYVDEYIPEAVRAAMAETASPGVTMLGYCFGAILGVLFTARHPEPVRNFIGMATPVDFTEMGFFVNFFREGRLKPDDLIDPTGNVPPDVVYNSFRTMKPTGDLAAYANLWQNIWNSQYVEGFQRMNQWARDHVPFPGAAFRQTVDMLMRGNGLMENTVRLGGRPVDLKAVRCPLLNVLAEHDHIVRLDAARPLCDIVGSVDKEELLVPGGHVAMVTGRLAAKSTIPGISEWLRRHADPLPSTTGSATSE
jgi:polyhydroxyalkanoate synthase